jgi:tryptophanyl-tRNA synthetase
VTDSGREIVFDVANKPGVANLLTIAAELTGSQIPDLVGSFAGKGYGDLKKEVAAAVVEFVTGFRERTRNYLDDSEALDAVLARGAERAGSVARETLAVVYDRVGFLAAKR